MTVIALFEDLQLAISDVLLTVDDKTISTVTPTTGDTANLASLELGVSRLARKIISAGGPAGSAQFLVAGKVSHIEYFAALLRQVFRHQLPLPEELRDLVRNLGPVGCFQVAARLADADGFKEFEVIGVAGSNMCTHTFDAQRIVTTIPYFGKVRIAGSGALNLLNWLTIRGDHYLKEFSHHDPMERHMHVADTVTLVLLGEDTDPRLRTLKTGVGGYYEAYSISNGVMAPVGDVLTVFCDIVGRNRDCKVNIKRLFYHCYRGECLYVFSLLQEVELTASSAAKIPFSICKLFKVDPLNQHSEPSPWGIHRVVSEMLGAQIVRTVVRKDVNKHTLTKRFMRNMPGPQMLKLTLSGDQLIATLDLDGFQLFASRFPSNAYDSIEV